MNRYFVCISLFILVFVANTKLSSQTIHLYDANLVGSLIDEDAIFPQAPGLEYGLLLRSGLEFKSSNQIQLDATYVRLRSDVNVYMIGLRNNFRNAKRSWSPSFEYIDLYPFKSYLLGLDYEYYANDLLTVTTGFIYEIKNIFVNAYHYDFSFLIYFTDQLMLRSGIAFTGTSWRRPLFEAIVGFEFLPKKTAISIFFELGNELVFQNQIGLKYNFGEKKTLKQRHRRVNMSTRFL